jgi:hypothetical protein
MKTLLRDFLSSKVYCCVFDELVSRHSGGSVRPTVGLSGIGCFCNVFEKKDSGQAGMTNKE